jgi:hypothetical protein
MGGSAMLDQFTSFLEVPGVQGLCFHQGPSVLANHFPKLYGQEGVEDLCTAVATAYQAYAHVGRPPTQSWFEFDEGIILTFCAPVHSTEGETAADPMFLTFLLSQADLAAQLIAPTRAFLNRQARSR